jgi:5-hydroxyisourate hydrolase
MISISTHALNTSSGKPAKGLNLHLERNTGNNTWERIANGTTNDDGRAPGLIPAERILSMGVYRMVFDTGGYFTATGVQGFYPIVEVVFEIREESHYHIPLLLSPYGYSTYRGS